ncbi:50S ribosomal protein L35ae, partial [Candidatus Pacearchaeota archaeon]|nr:50S ribosomal protein L35ae [Candidatus Pacearchaeota archaeon]
RHFLIEVEGVSNREDAGKLVGKDVEWKSPAGKVIKGKISSAHGNNGVVRAIFEKGLPGQAVTTGVEIK